MTRREQTDMLTMIKAYNTTDRMKIKNNLFHIIKTQKITRDEIVNDMGWKYEKISGWLNRKNPNVPMLEDALCMAQTYNFSITDLMN